MPDRQRQLLGGWTPRDTAQQLQRLTRYSSFVHFGKYGLFALTGALLILVFVIPVLHEDDDDATRLVFTNIQMGEELDKPRMMAPKFQGLDESQQPYKLNAEYAERTADGGVFLNKVDADIQLNSGAWVAMFSDEALYDMKNKTVRMPKNVNIFHDGGYEVRTENVFAELDKSLVTGESPITIQGAFGTLKAKGFSIDGANKTVLFHTDVVVRLYPGKDGGE